jgi:hypothetical protein
MSALTADDLYEMAQRLPASERLRLVEKIAHHLTLAREPDPRESSRPPVSGARIRTQLIGQVTDIAVDPLRFTIRTSRGEISVAAGLDLTENVWSAWGHEVIADVDAFLDLEGKTLDAVAISLDLSAQADDLISNFESTFGSGSEIWSSAEARGELGAMRGGRP